MLFCDLSTPKNDGTFNIYDDIKNKLVERGVPADEVAFIHDADSEAKKKRIVFQSEKRSSQSSAWQYAKRWELVPMFKTSLLQFIT